jgi:hypothetical protein
VTVVDELPESWQTGSLKTHQKSSGERRAVAAWCVGDQRRVGHPGRGFLSTVFVLGLGKRRDVSRGAAGFVTLGSTR